MTDKPDTNLPGSKPDVGGVVGEGNYAATSDSQNRASKSVSGFMDGDRDARRDRKVDQRSSLMDAESLARMNAYY
jgi:hypothetical protein